MKDKIKAFWVIIVVLIIGMWLWKGDTFAQGAYGKELVLGLDLAGGSSLVYTIQTDKLRRTDVECFC